jgi:hypothetical protein
MEEWRKFLIHIPVSTVIILHLIWVLFFAPRYTSIIILNYVLFDCSYRFMDLFPAACLVRDMQAELDSMIQQGVFQLTRLLKNSETGVSSGTPAAIDEEDFAINRQKQSYLRGIML